MARSQAVVIAALGAVPSLCRDVEGYPAGDARTLAISVAAVARLARGRGVLIVLRVVSWLH